MTEQEKALIPGAFFAFQRRIYSTKESCSLMDEGIGAFFFIDLITAFGSIRSFLFQSFNANCL